MGNVAPGKTPSLPSLRWLHPKHARGKPKSARGRQWHAPSPPPPLSPGPAGLPNVSECQTKNNKFRLPSRPPSQLGNTCYLGAVLQALYYCEEVRAAVLATLPAGVEAKRLGAAGNATAPKTTSKAAAPSVDAALARVFAALRDRRPADECAREVRQLLRLMAATQPEYGDAGQHDAQETLNFLLNCMLARAPPPAAGAGAEPSPWVRALVEGQLECNTTCLSCERVRACGGGEEVIDPSLSSSSSRCARTRRRF
jgi:hypothetical protein